MLVHLQDYTVAKPSEYIYGYIQFLNLMVIYTLLTQTLKQLIQTLLINTNIITIWTYTINGLIIINWLTIIID